MKTFVKENWYKLMIGCSMFIFSVSALIYSVSPARAENVFNAKNNSDIRPYSDYVVVNGVVYGLSVSENGLSAEHWDELYAIPK
jgi:hypothetical protein